MKKTTILRQLLFLLFSISVPVNCIEAQTFLSRSTGFPAAGTQAMYTSIVDDNIIWTYGNNTAYVSVSTDKGNTWTVSQPGIPAGYLISGMSAVSATTAYLAINDFVTGLTGVFKTTNSGTTWVRQSTAAFDGNSFINIVHFFDTNNGIATGDPDDLGYFEIYTTSNGGTLWTRVPQASIPALIPGEYGVNTQYDRVGDTFWFMSAGSAQRLYKSTNKGLTWTVTNYSAILPTSSHFFSFSDVNKGLMYSKNGSVLSLYRTLDGGATFNPVTLTGVGDIVTIEYIPGTTAALLSGTSGTFYSNNDGTNWMNIDANYRPYLTFRNREIGFASGSTVSATSGGINKFVNTVSIVGSQIGTPWTTDIDFVTTDGVNYTLSNQALQAGDVKFRQNHEWGPTSMDWGSTSFPSGTGVNGGPDIPVSAATYNITFNKATGAYNFSQVLGVSDLEKKDFTFYPNPTRNVLNIHSDIPIDKLVIFEPTGKKVMEINNPNTQIDVAQLSAGIYLMRLTAEGKDHQTKFIKL